MGWTSEEIAGIKNQSLKDKILRLKSKALTVPVVNSAPTPPVLVSSSTIIKPALPKSTEIFFIVPGEPLGKPRMTQRDTWKKRPCVVRYRAYCDKIRASAGTIPTDPIAVHIRAYIAVSDSWSKKKKAEILGKRHRAKPDWDNIGKAVCDALFEEDSCIALGIAEKFWCASGAERTEVCVIYDESVLSRYGTGINNG